MYIRRYILQTLRRDTPYLDCFLVSLLYQHSPQRFYHKSICLYLVYHTTWDLFFLHLFLFRSGIFSLSLHELQQEDSSTKR